jgi:uncharacterized LabA/DUF88 family protein
MVRNRIRNTFEVIPNAGGPAESTAEGLVSRAIGGFIFYVMALSKVAILIDGGFFIRRFKALYSKSPKIGDIQSFLDDIMAKVQATSHTSITDVLLRSFYYDCRPFGDLRSKPDGTMIDFSRHPQFRAATAFQNELRTFPQMALRLGDLSFDGWKVDPKNPSNLIPDFKQKSVDIKIGLDIAWMSSKKTIDKLVLVAGDSDFMSPMKFARKEGILVYLCPMGQTHIKIGLKEHADFII